MYIVKIEMFKSMYKFIDGLKNNLVVLFKKKNYEKYYMAVSLCKEYLCLWTRTYHQLDNFWNIWNTFYKKKIKFSVEKETIAQ